MNDFQNKVPTLKAVRSVKQTIQITKIHLPQFIESYFGQRKKTNNEVY